MLYRHDYVVYVRTKPGVLGEAKLLTEQAFVADEFRNRHNDREGWNAAYIIKRRWELVDQTILQPPRNGDTVNDNPGILDRDVEVTATSTPYNPKGVR